MDGDQNIRLNLSGTVPFGAGKTEDGNMQDFTTVEEKLRQIMSANNKNPSNTLVGENKLTGGPPPAKPFPGTFPTSTNNQVEFKVRKF